MTVFSSIRPAGLHHGLIAHGVAGMAELVVCMSFPASAAPAPDTYVGHLGDVPVGIPRAYGRFLEYDGDPHFMEKRKGEAPPRDYESGIRGFAFEVHFPDMAVLDIRSRDATPKETLATRRWLRVLVSANSDFMVDGETYMARATKEIRTTGTDPYRGEPGQAYGLQSFSKIKDSERHVGAVAKEGIWKSARMERRRPLSRARSACMRRVVVPCSSCWILQCMRASR